jgi:hypothetical protein
LVEEIIEMQRSLQSVVSTSTFAPSSADSHTVLRELFELLEDYAPMWYTEEHHNLLAGALGEPLFEPSIQ